MTEILQSISWMSEGMITIDGDRRLLFKGDWKMDRRNTGAGEFPPVGRSFWIKQVSVSLIGDKYQWCVVGHGGRFGDWIAHGLGGETTIFNYEPEMMPLFEDERGDYFDVHVGGRMEGVVPEVLVMVCWKLI
jgi:hypothetical protein